LEITNVKFGHRLVLVLSPTLKWQMAYNKSLKMAQKSWLALILR
jgi:hypothetical protein